MKLERKKLIERITKGVRPSFVISVLLAAAVFGAGARYMIPRDAIIGLVPSNTAVYLHENRLVPEKSLLRIPDGLIPDEVAVVAVVDEIAELEWTTLVAWSGNGPNEAERDVLKAAGSREMKKNVFALSDTSFEAGTTPTLEDTEESRGLARLRPTFPLQGLINFNVLPPYSLPDFLQSLKENGPVLIGVASGDTRLLAIVAPAAEARKWSNLGYGLTPGRIERRPVGVDDTSFSLSASLSPVDPITALFGPIEEERLLTGAPLVREYTESRADLYLLLSGTSNIRMEAGGQVYSANFTRIDAEMVASAVHRYLLAALPGSMVLNLPDNDTFREFQPNEAITVQSSSNKGLRSWVFDLDAIGLKLTVADDGNHGTVVSASRPEGPFNLSRETIKPHNCPKESLNDVVITTIPEVIHTLLSTNLQHYPQISTVLFTNTDGNSVFFCGYK
ncbi:hypothetical protein HY633_02695 [Candidatus Uhrbacteria bacterium]|nr:hypothetical protein [Candidatus Uhrbacteria bacterium]